MKYLQWIQSKTHRHIYWLNARHNYSKQHLHDLVGIPKALAKTVKFIKLNIADVEITAKPYIQYFGVMIDGLNFNQQVEHVRNKTSVVRNQLSQLAEGVFGAQNMNTSKHTSTGSSVAILRSIHPVQEFQISQRSFFLFVRPSV